MCQKMSIINVSYYCYSLPNNIMFDPRVVRGSAFVSKNSVLNFLNYIILIDSK